MLTRVASRSIPSGAINQATALRNEGVEVAQNAMGELTVSLATYGWFVEALPSELGFESDIEHQSE